MKKETIENAMENLLVVLDRISKSQIVSFFFISTL